MKKRTVLFYDFRCAILFLTGAAFLTSGVTGVAAIAKEISTDKNVEQVCELSDDYKKTVEYDFKTLDEQKNNGEITTLEHAKKYNNINSINYKRDVVVKLDDVDEPTKKELKSDIKASKVLLATALTSMGTTVSGMATMGAIMAIDKKRECGY